jgi:hypothetical protein
LSARYLDYLSFGADADGISYRAEGQLSLGPRLRLDPHHALFLRLGARGRIVRAAGIYDSAVELPVLEAGVRHESSWAHIEAAAVAAPVLAGFYRPPEGTLALRGARSSGGHVSLAAGRVRFDAEGAWVWRTDGVLLQQTRIQACWALEKALLCADGRSVWVPSGTHAVPESSAHWAGLSLLVGQREWLYPAP